MGIKIEYQEGLYHFIWIKGTIELLLGFIMGIAEKYIVASPFYSIATIVLVLAGFSDIMYFFKLKDARKG